MSNILEFKPKKVESKVAMYGSEHMFTLHMYQDYEGQFEVNMETSDNHSDLEIFEAMMAATMKFGTEHDVLIEDELEIVDEDDS